MLLVALAGALVLSGAGIALVLLRASSQTVTTTTSTSTSTVTITTTTTDGLEFLDDRCNRGDAQSCVAVGAMHENGHGGRPADPEKARSYYDRACKMGDQGGCTLRDLLAKPSTPPEKPIPPPKPRPRATSTTTAPAPTQNAQPPVCAQAADARARGDFTLYQTLAKRCREAGGAPP